MTTVINNKYINTLEIGLAMGASAVWICQAHKDNMTQGKHVAIDPNQTTQYNSIGLSTVKNSGLENFMTLIENFSYLALPLLLENIRTEKIPKFDMIYIDGWHTFDYTLVDFFYSDKMLRIGGSIIIDDVKHQGVKKCVKYILENYKNYRAIETGLTTNILLVKTGDDDRPWFFS